MQELVVLVLGAAVVLVLWRTLKAFLDHGNEMALASGFGPHSEFVGPDVLRWPALGQFAFPVTDATGLCQPILRRLYASGGAPCTATLHPGGNGQDTGAPVEVRVQGEHVGYLADGDATRFHHRLAYEGRPGQLSQCSARITVDDVGRRGERRQYAIALDLKPFRH